MMRGGPNCQEPPRESSAADLNPRAVPGSLFLVSDPPRTPCSSHANRASELPRLSPARRAAGDGLLQVSTKQPISPTATPLQHSNIPAFQYSMGFTHHPRPTTHHPRKHTHTLRSLRFLLVQRYFLVQPDRPRGPGSGDDVPVRIRGSAFAYGKYALW